MNRELKFRVWDLISKKFDPITYKAGESFGHPSSVDWIALQYTGMEDINGKEIFEGDIVKYIPDQPPIRIGIIEYSDYYNGWSIKDSQCYPASVFGVYSLTITFLSLNNIQIIGNIFENPELLK